MASLYPGPPLIRLVRHGTNNAPHLTSIAPYRVSGRTNPMCRRGDTIYLSLALYGGNVVPDVMSFCFLCMAW
eukprot:scaffold40836_cov122-Skeletonema_dohrnii-CCMP3373.AAC.2